MSIALVIGYRCFQIIIYCHDQRSSIIASTLSTLTGLEFAIFYRPLLSILLFFLLLPQCNSKSRLEEDWNFDSCKPYHAFNTNPLILLYCDHSVGVAEWNEKLNSWWLSIDEVVKRATPGVCEKSWICMELARVASDSSCYYVDYYTGQRQVGTFLLYGPRKLGHDDK